MMALDPTFSTPVLPGYSFRTVRREDLPAVHELLERVAAVDRTGFVDTLEDMINQFYDPWCDPGKDYLVALTSSGQVVGTGRVFVNPTPRKERYAILSWEVHPEHRDRGLDELILTWMEANGRQHLLEYPADLPRSLRTSCHDYLSDRISLFEQHGFNPVRFTYRMRRDLSQPIPEQALPDNLTLCNYRPELDRALMEACNEAFQDNWGFEPIFYEDWQMFMIHAITFRPTLTYLALEGVGSDTRVVGFSLNLVREEDNQRQGITEGYIANLGTQQAWRKRGVATALLCASMHAFKKAGLNYAALGVDTENATGALQLYERLGFKAIKRSIIFEKPVD